MEPSVVLFIGNSLAAKQAPAPSHPPGTIVQPMEPSWVDYFLVCSKKKKNKLSEFFFSRRCLIIFYCNAIILDYFCKNSK